ncbi:hypothetical protein ABT167_36380 [Streptomyces sp. NPDC001792]|uniref:hypothetical protein n=1 Tax=Streptomyces sp. NPDC001792 TaxID=3154524 RepID=UPI00332841DF
MIERKDVEFQADDAVTLRGWLFLPDGPGPHLAITMAHGYAGLKAPLPEGRGLVTLQG